MQKKAQWLTTSVRQNTWNKELLALQVQLSSTPPVTCLTQPLNPNAHTAACSYGRRLRRKHWIFCAQHIVSRARGVRCPLCSAHNRGDGHRLVEPHVCARQSMIQVNRADVHTATATVSDIVIKCCNPGSKPIMTMWHFRKLEIDLKGSSANHEILVLKTLMLLRSVTYVDIELSHPTYSQKEWRHTDQSAQFFYLYNHFQVMQF